MIGLGIDLCEIVRMERLLEQNDRFLQRYFTAEEQQYIHSRGKAGAESMAAMFAAKEALLKALGTGLSGKAALAEIEVCHEESGRPRYRLLGAAQQALSDMGGSRVHLSLSHEAGIAAAVAVIE